MKKIFKYSSLLVAILSVMACRDVTQNDLDGTASTQGSDPVVVDKPVAYVQRSVPIEIDDDGNEVGVMPENILMPQESSAGAVLVLKDRASVSAASRVITEGVFPLVDGEEPLYDVRDLSTNEDGTKLVFSMRAPLIDGLDDDDPGQPTWNIWEYDLENDSLSLAVPSRLLPERGHDRYPVYLPDDSIVFASTRQAVSRVLMPIHPRRPQYSYVTEGDDETYAFTLHRIDEDRESITQISFGKGHDIQPTVLLDGRILFVRWDDTSRRNGDRLSLYTMNPDGSNVSLYYGFHSPSGSGNASQGALTKPVQLPNGNILVNYRPRETSQLGGDIYTVNGEDYIDITQPVSSNLGATGPAENSVSIGQVVLEDQSPHGYFNSVYPLDDGTNRLLVSWMPCLVLGYRLNIYVEEIEPQDLDDDGEPDTETQYLLIDIDGNYVDEDGDRLATGATPVEIAFDELGALPCSSNTFDNDNITPADPQFGIWVYDTDRETQTPVVLANRVGIMFSDAVVFEQRTPATIINNSDNSELRSELVDEQVGLIHIRSVYDFDGTDTTPNGIAAMADPIATPPDSRPVRFVRFYEEASMPHEDDYEIEEDAVGGRFNNPGRSIIGYAEVHPDGSVMAKVPANTAFSMEYVDANGRRLTGNYGQRHDNWLNLRAGEIRECNGCHTPNSTAPHGRLDAEAESANPGALVSDNFLNTQLVDPTDTPYDIFPELGETMAEYYVRIQRLALIEEDPLALSLDLNYTDVWSDTDIVPSSNIGTDISIEFGVPPFLAPENLLTDAPVPLSKCLSEWSFDCRTVIDYPEHIQPIFAAERTRDDGMGGTETYTCLDCHSPTDPDDMAQIPSGPDGFQFDFTDEPSPLDMDGILLRGYDELFAAGDPLLVVNPDTLMIEIQFIPQVINGVTQFGTTAIVDVDGNATFEFINLAGDTICAASGSEIDDPDLTPVIDPDTALPVACIRNLCTTDQTTADICSDRNTAGAEIFNDNVIPNGIFDRGESCVVRQPICEAATQTRYLNANGANNGNNRRFFQAFETGGAHEGYLTPAEIKLFSEYLDMGSQFQNEIFKAVVD